MLYVDKVALIFILVTLSQTPAETALCRVECLFSFQFALVPIYIAWWQRHMCVNKLPWLSVKVEHPEVKPAMYADNKIK